MSAALKLKQLENAQLRDLLETYTNAGVGITFECMLMYVPTYTGATVPSGNQDLYDYSGIIRLKGKEFCVESCLSFPKATIEMVVKKIFGFKEGDIPDSHIDGCLGELTNTVSGCIKAQMNKAGYECHLDLPELFKGRGAQVFKGNSVVHKFDFEMDGCPFSVFLAILYNS